MLFDKPFRNSILQGCCCGILAFTFSMIACWSFISSAAAEPEEVRGVVIGSSNGETLVVHPVSLRVTYRDEKIHPGITGDVIREGTATYTFKNTLPVPVKLAFPPTGYVFGSAVPITPYCNDPEQMPRFCQTARVVELKPFAEQRFQSSYNIPTAARGPRPPIERFVFGAPSGSKEKNFVVDMIQSVGEFGKGSKGEIGAVRQFFTDFPVYTGIYVIVGIVVGAILGPVLRRVCKCYPSGVIQGKGRMAANTPQSQSE